MAWQPSPPAAVLFLVVVGLTSCGQSVAASRVGWGAEQVAAERRCEQGDAGSCGDLGRWLVARTESVRSFQRGMVLLEVACGRDDLRACTALGAIYGRQRSDNAQAHARALDLLTRACDRGAAEACTELDRLMRREDLPAQQRA